jgi:hypothetical protein
MRKAWPNLRELGVAEICPAQVCTCKICLVKSGAFKLGTAELSGSEMRADEANPLHLCLDETSTIQLAFRQDGTA